MNLDTEERAASWLNKNVAAACRQIDGTIRTLKSQSDDLILTSMRGKGIPWQGGVDVEFYGLVVVNYTPPPGYIPRPISSVPTMILQIHDWEFINRILWSATNLLGYMVTRAGLPTVPMEAEKDLFAHVIEAEQADTRIGLPGGQPLPGKWDGVVQRWPDVDIRSRPDAEYAYVIDKVMGAMARDDLAYSSLRSPSEYLDSVGTLDEIPVLERVEMGKAFIERAKRAQSESRGVSCLGWPGGGRLGSQIVFLADPRKRAARFLWIVNLATTRHAELMSATGYSGLRTLGIATEAWPLTGGSHDFVLLRGDVGLSVDDLAEREEVFPRPQFPDEAISQLRNLGDGTG
jgi:hypothetical protein